MRAIVFLALLGCACRPVTPAPTPETPPATPMQEPEPSSEEPSPAPALEPTHVLQPRAPINLDRSTTLTVEEVIIETIEPSPDGSYPSGGAIVVPLLLKRDAYEVHASLLDITEGYEGRLVAWLEGYRIALVEVTQMHTNPQVALTVESVTEQRLDGPPERVHIERGQAVTLADGHQLEFAGHSHKMLEAGQSSPLIISMRWNLPGFDPVDDSVNLETSAGERSWRFRDRELTLVDWDYDRWMELEIHALARVRVPPS